MAKVYAEQVKKAQLLAEGLKKNYEQVKNRGISMEEIAQLEADANEAARMNAEVEALREEISRKAALANQKLIKVKSNMMNAKAIIKRCFDPYKWPDFGVLDKR